MNSNTKFYESIVKTVEIYNSFSSEMNFHWTEWKNSEQIEIIAKKDPIKGRSLYLDELFQKIQFVALIGIIRSTDWAKSIKLGIENNNYMAFSSSLRGALESAGDIYYSLNTAPNILASNFALFQSVFDGTLPKNTAVIAEKLEKLLLHFVWATRQSKKNMKSVENYEVALFNSDYIKNLDKNGSYKLLDLYKVLCNISHPAHYTVLGLVKTENNETILKSDYNETWIDFLTTQYSTSYKKIIETPFSLCLMTLWFLNRFKNNSFFSPFVENFNFENNTTWVELNKKMNNNKS